MSVEKEMVKAESTSFLYSVERGARVLVVFAGQRGAGIPYSIGTAQLLVDHGCQVDMLVSSAVLDPCFRVPKGINRLFSFEAKAAGLTKLCACTAQIQKAKRRAKESFNTAYDLAIVVMESPFSTLPLCLVGGQDLAMRRVLTIHDASPHPGDFVSQISHKIHGLALLWATEIIAPSTFTANRLVQERGIRKPIRVLPINHVHASALKQFVSPIQPQAFCHHRGFRFVIVGRLLAYKGTAMLAELMACLKNQQGWLLEIAGAGLSPQFVQQLQAMDERINVLRDWMDWEKYYDRLAQADCLLCLHTEASQSGPIADAVALKMPIVSSNVGGLPEQLEGYPKAILCDPTPEGVASAMAEMISKKHSKHSKTSKQSKSSA